MHWLLHALGIDTQQSMPYDFLSGAGAAIPGWISASSVVFGVWAFVRHRNCHRRGCWRVGRHVVDGTPWCNRHHEAARGKA